MAWQVFRDGESMLLISRDLPEEAIAQARGIFGLAPRGEKGEWVALPWNAKEHLDRERLP
jgi:hypothetical protein